MYKNFAFSLIFSFLVVRREEIFEIHSNSGNDLCSKRCQQTVWSLFVHGKLSLLRLCNKFFSWWTGNSDESLGQKRTSKTILPTDTRWTCSKFSSSERVRNFRLTYCSCAREQVINYNPTIGNNMFSGKFIMTTNISLKFIFKSESRIHKSNNIEEERRRSYCKILTLQELFAGSSAMLTSLNGHHTSIRTFRASSFCLDCKYCIYMQKLK